MQTSVPDVMESGRRNCKRHSEHYGVEGGSDTYAVQYARGTVFWPDDSSNRVYGLSSSFNGSDPSGGNGITNWDSHSRTSSRLMPCRLRSWISRQPRALIADLREQRGMLGESHSLFGPRSLAECPFCRPTEPDATTTLNAFTCFLTGAGVKRCYQLRRAVTSSASRQLLTTQRRVYDFNATLSAPDGARPRAADVLPQRPGATAYQCAWTRCETGFGMNDKTSGQK